MVQPGNDFIIVKDAVETAGCVTYWRASGSVSIEALSKAWTDAGLDPELLRKPPEPVTALRRATIDLATRVTVNETTEKRTLIRPCQEPHTWAVVEETVQEGFAPAYTTVAIVSFVESKPHVSRIDGTEAQAVDVETLVTAGFTSQQGLYAPEDITGWLVALSKKQNAVTLRDSGGVYFIPQPSMEFWNKAADVIQAVSAQGHMVLRIPAMKNAEAIAAITDAVSREAEQVAAAMDTELSLTGDEALGTRALKTRSDQAKALLDKISAYEKLLGLQMEIRERIEALAGNLAIAAMSAPEQAA